MSVVIAVDAGTTGVRVVRAARRRHRGGLLVPGVHPALPPARLGRARRRPRSGPRCRRPSPSSSASSTSPSPPSASPTSGRRSWRGTGAPASRCTAPSSGRTAARRAAATSSAPRASSRSCGPPPASCSTRTSPPPRRSGCSPRAAWRSRPTWRIGTDRRLGAVEPHRRHRRRGARHRAVERQPHHALRHPHAGLVRRAPRPLRGARRRPCPRCGRRAVASGSRRAAPGVPAGIPVSGIAGDQQAALFGQACLEPGMTKNTYGTGSFVLMNVGDRCPEPVDGLLTTVGWTLADGTRAYALEGAIFVTGAAVQWLRDGLGIIERAERDRRARGDGARHRGLLRGARPSPASGARGGTPTPGAPSSASPGAPVAATSPGPCSTSISLQTRDVVAAMSEASGHPIRALKADGGAAANDLLLQLQADDLQVPVSRPVIQETTALGAAYLAGLAEGVWALPRRHHGQLAPRCHLRADGGSGRVRREARRPGAAPSIVRAPGTPERWTDPTHRPRGRRGVAASWCSSGSRGSRSASRSCRSWATTRRRSPSTTSRACPSSLFALLVAVVPPAGAVGAGRPWRRHDRPARRSGGSTCSPSAGLVGLLRRPGAQVRRPRAAAGARRRSRSRPGSPSRSPTSASSRWPLGVLHRGPPRARGGVLHLRLARVRAAHPTGRHRTWRGRGRRRPVGGPDRPRRAPHPVAARRGRRHRRRRASRTWPPSPTTRPGTATTPPWRPLTDAAVPSHAHRASSPTADAPLYDQPPGQPLHPPRADPRARGARVRHDALPLRRAASPTVTGEDGTQEEVDDRGARASATCSTSPVDLWFDRVSLGPRTPPALDDFAEDVTQRRPSAADLDGRRARRRLRRGLGDERRSTQRRPCGPRRSSTPSTPTRVRRSTTCTSCSRTSRGVGSRTAGVRRRRLRSGMTLPEDDQRAPVLVERRGSRAVSEQRHLLQAQYADRLVGELLDGLRAEGLYDDSLVIVTADHGDLVRDRHRAPATSTDRRSTPSPTPRCSSRRPARTRARSTTPT